MIQYSVNFLISDLHTLIDTLGWEYQRMGKSGRETYDEICHLLNMIPEDEAIALYNRGHYKDSNYDLDDMFYDYEFVDIKEESELINPEPEVF